MCDPNDSWQHEARVQLCEALLTSNLASEPWRKYLTIDFATRALAGNTEHVYSCARFILEVCEKANRETTAAQIVGHLARICDPSGSWQHGARVQLRVFHIGALLKSNLANKQRRKQVT